MTRAAVILTAAVLLLLLWSGIRLLLLSEPDPILPAGSSMRIAAIQYGTETDDELPGDLVSRPVFWQDRQAYAADDSPVDTIKPVQSGKSSALDKVKLLGVYSGRGAKSGIVISYEGERRRLRLKESIEGWTFTMLSADSAFFEKGDEGRAIQLEHSTPVASAGGEINDRKRDAAGNNDKTGE